MSEIEENETPLGQGAMDNAITVLRNLEAAGMPSEQADCVVNSMQTLINASRETISTDLDKRDLLDKATFRLESEAISRRVVGEEIDKRDLVSEDPLKAEFAKVRAELEKLRVEFLRHLRINTITTVVLLSAEMAAFFYLAGHFG
ncbi:MAG: hypothetical protein ACR2PJ_05450 [Pseudomonadales bacterium]